MQLVETKKKKSLSSSSYKNDSFKQREKAKGANKSPAVLKEVSMDTCPDSQLLGDAANLAEQVSCQAVKYSFR